METLESRVKAACECKIKCECGNPADYYNTSSDEFVCEVCKDEVICYDCPVETCQECHLKLKKMVVV